MIIRVVYRCDYCGHEFDTHPWVVGLSSNKHYCSIDCRNAAPVEDELRRIRDLNPGRDDISATSANGLVLIRYKGEPPRMV